MAEIFPLRLKQANFASKTFIADVVIKADFDNFDDKLKDLLQKKKKKKKKKCNER